MKHLTISARKLKVMGASVLASLFLLLSLATPAQAYWSHYIKDSYGGRWGTSCPPIVEYHGNGYETVKERRNQQLQGFGLGWYEIKSCTLTGYTKTGYYTQSFPIYY